MVDADSILVLAIKADYILLLLDELLHPTDPLEGRVYYFVQLAPPLLRGDIAALRSMMLQFAQVDSRVGIVPESIRLEEA
jgi:hypothetical protein